MNYIGSKYRLLPFLDQSIKHVVGDDLSRFVFCDLFAGTGIVGRHFKNQVKSVIANDWEYYSYILNRHYIGNSEVIVDADDWIVRLNELPGQKGFIWDQYAEGGSAGRLYFATANGQKIDAIRSQIESWKLNQEIGENLYFFLLASLLESADRVANTASVYGAFLKKIKTSAAKELVLQPAQFYPSTQEHSVFREDSNKLIDDIQGDILYLDPPYNSRQYGANYHLLNTLATYKSFDPKGKTGLDDYLKSDYCSSAKVLASLTDLLTKAKFKYIFLSYNNEGLMPEDEIKKVMDSLGSYQLLRKNYQRFKADKTENRNHKYDQVEEHLHVLVKED